MHHIIDKYLLIDVNFAWNIVRSFEMIYASPTQKMDAYTKMSLYFLKGIGDMWINVFMGGNAQFLVIQVAPGRVL